jgi:CRP-like cAMP-binding protein
MPSPGDGVGSESLESLIESSISLHETLSEAPIDDDSALEAVRLARQIELLSRDVIADAARIARQRRLTWQRIGQAAGVTQVTAFNRWRHLERRDEADQ